MGAGCHTEANVEERSWVKGPLNGEKPVLYVRCWYCVHNNWTKTAEEFYRQTQTTALKNKIEYHGRADLRKADVFSISLHKDSEAAKSMGYDADKADKGKLIWEK